MSGNRYSTSAAAYLRTAGVTAGAPTSRRAARTCRAARRAAPTPTSPATAGRGRRTRRRVARRTAPAGRAPTARSRMGRSLAPACVIIVAGACSTSTSARTSHASGSTSATPFGHDTCTRHSCGQYVRSDMNSVSSPYAGSSSRTLTSSVSARSSSTQRGSCRTSRDRGRLDLDEQLRETPGGRRRATCRRVRPRRRRAAPRALRRWSGSPRRRSCRSSGAPRWRASSRLRAAPPRGCRPPT